MHLAAWFCASQMALEAQGLANRQGLMHLLRWQTWSVLQSGSTWHSTKVKKVSMLVLRLSWTCTRISKKTGSEILRIVMNFGKLQKTLFAKTPNQFFVRMLTFLTFNFWVSWISWWAEAKRFVVENLALCIYATVAGIDAKSVMTGLVSWTLIIMLTADGNWLCWKKDEK